MLKLYVFQNNRRAQRATEAHCLQVLEDSHCLLMCINTCNGAHDECVIMSVCRPDKGKGGSNGPTPKGTPQSTPRGLATSWGQANPMTPKGGSSTTVKTALQDMKQVTPPHLAIVSCMQNSALDHAQDRTRTQDI